MIVTNMLYESWLLFSKKNWHIVEFWNSWLSNKAQLIYPFHHFFSHWIVFLEKMINYSQFFRSYLIQLYLVLFFVICCQYSKVFAKSKAQKLGGSSSFLLDSASFSSSHLFCSWNSSPSPSPFWSVPVMAKTNLDKIASFLNFEESGVYSRLNQNIFFLDFGLNSISPKYAY